MSGIAGRILREPLLHFLLIGSLIFVGYFILNPVSPGLDDRRIEVTPEVINRLQETWIRQWQRPPDAGELSSMINDYIREEVLYREAKALGLDQDDTIIRRRLAQKMEFLTEDLTRGAEPSEQELRAWFASHRSDFMEPARLSFVHVYLNPDRRGSAADTDAALMLEELRAAGVTDPTGRGDPFLMQTSYSELTRRDASQLFGSEFAERLFELPIGSWQGPLTSGFGLHLVLITARIEEQEPEFAAITDRLRTEFEYDRRRRNNQEILDRLRQRYQIVIDTPVPEGQTGAAGDGS